jgi:hypothetical protein
MGTRPVTLLIADDPDAATAKRVSHRREGALDVASWSHGRRSYVLVSSFGGGATTSACTLCHSTPGPAALL